ncbi:hypothetical protein MiYa_01732 [Microcystis aeruginosa NIES-2519]|uniref:DUF4214 domain-containing protein n=1 Tax=Microcystis aeruginosa NIES-2519 TaxID=2303981 RepID=A0A5A5R3A6_MICAE|nr:DUF4214 domain-containing protein [Microcystis aeruginosa]GCA70200.1 hypothetical protein MiYa_01732 [Microcystis aeruginosa NIES-2519]
MAVDQNSIVGLYVIYFNRAPDPAGLTFWQTQDVTIEEMAAQFGASPEAQSLYPFLAAPTLANPEEFINEIYRNAFGRDADEAGLAFWSGVLEQDSSPESVAQFVLAVAQGAQGTDQVALQNRADIALQFTQDFVNANIAFTSSVFATSSDIISTVTFEEESVTAAQAAIDQAIIASQPSNTVTLTPNVDTLTANSFLAPTVSSSGQFNATFNSGDSLTGSGTNPTLTVLNTGGTTLNTGAVLPTMKGIETLNVVNTGNVKLQVLGANVVGVKNVDLSDSTQGLELSNFQTAVEKVSVSRAALTADVLLNITVAAAALAGSEDTVAVTLNQVGSVDPTTGAAIQTFDGKGTPTNNVSQFTLGLDPVSGNNGYEKISIESKGQANLVEKLTANGSKQITITGDQNLRINQALPNTAVKLDASALQGNLDVTAGNGTVDFLGGKGNDTFRFNVGEFTATDKVDGGEGANTLVVVAADAEAITAADTNIKNTQTLTLSTGGTATKTLRADLIGDKITTVNLTAVTAGDYTIRFAAGANSVNVLKNTSATKTLNVEANGGGNTDSLTFTIDGDDPTTPLLTEKANITVGNLNLNNTDTPNRSIEKLNLVVNNSVAGTHTIGAITLPAAAGEVETITITGNSTLTIGGAVTAEKLDASGLTEATNGTTGLTMTKVSNPGSTVGINLTGSTFDDALIGSVANDFISGGAGKDTITGSGGSDQITLGDGFDTVIFDTKAVAGNQALNLQEKYSTVTDFLTGATATTTDLITISNAGVTGGSLENLTGGAVVTGVTGDKVQNVDVAQGASVNLSTSTANFLRLTGTGSNLPANTAQAGFNAAIGAGVITVGAASIDILTSYYDSANGQMVLGVVKDNDASSTITATTDVFTVISRFTMTAANYANFGNAQFTTFI